MGRRTEASGVRAGAELVALCEAAHARDAEALGDAREAVRRALGDDALVDACAVIGNFERMTRIADATGIPLDTPVQLVSEDFRERLGLDRFGAAANTRPLPRWARLLARPLRHGARWLVPLLGRPLRR